jgi:Polysaccharide deacetylase
MRDRAVTLKHAIAATLLVLSPAAPAHSADSPRMATGRALHAACWPGDTMAGLPGERRPMKGIPGAHQPMPTGAVQPFSPVQPQLRGAIRRVKLPPGKKLVALTLDLCESGGEVSGYDAAIINYLRQSGTKATLFTGGKWMLSHPGRTQQLLSDPLFEMANHGAMRVASPDQRCSTRSSGRSAPMRDCAPNSPAPSALPVPARTSRLCRSAWACSGFRSAPVIRKPWQQ